MEMEHLIRLIETVSGSKLSGFEYEEKGVKIRMEKPETQQAVSGLPVQTEICVQAAEPEQEDPVRW